MNLPGKMVSMTACAVTSMGAAAFAGCSCESTIEGWAASGTDHSGWSACAEAAKTIGGGAAACAGSATWNSDDRANAATVISCAML
jgi:hypothetical protein